MSKAFTSGDIVTPEVTRPLPVGRRPLTHVGFLRGQALLRRLAVAHATLRERAARGEAVSLLQEATARQIAWHERRLTLSDVAPAPTPPIQRAALGVRVSVRDEQDDALSAYTLVGPDEVDAALGRVSAMSPIGQALIGRQLGERVFIKRPKGVLEVVIEALVEDVFDDQEPLGP